MNQKLHNSRPACLRTGAVPRRCTVSSRGVISRNAVPSRIPRDAVPSRISRGAVPTSVSRGAVPPSRLPSRPAPDRRDRDIAQPPNQTASNGIHAASWCQKTRSFPRRLLHAKQLDRRPIPHADRPRSFRNMSLAHKYEAPQKGLVPSQCQRRPLKHVGFYGQRLDAEQFGLADAFKQRRRIGGR